MNERNETHDIEARSFVESANADECDFPLQNLPYGAFSRGNDSDSSLCVAIGDQVFDLREAACRKLLDIDEDISEACQDDCLNSLMGLGPERWSRLRGELFHLLHTNSTRRQEAADCLHSQSEVTLTMPVCIGDYTDFYTSVHHATNVGALFRPENPLLPNYKWVPIAYNGRASSIVLSGAAIRRPNGQLKAPDSAAPRLAPSQRLDYELEIGAFVGVGNELGSAIPITEAGDHIFGLCLLNDWSARDVQVWEYQPLGPFLAKSFATTISPWIVTTEALVPFRCPAATRPDGDPHPLPYLDNPDDALRGGFGIHLEAYLCSAKMREAGCPPHCIARSNLRDMYWTFSQMLAHHSSNGCNLRPGDLLGSGTISGPTAAARACLLELTRGGAEPITLPDGSQRTFLQDGDEVTLRAYCRREGTVSIGLGSATGVILPAR
jgi:fumarylacetoacetase